MRDLGQVLEHEGAVAAPVRQPTSARSYALPAHLHAHNQIAMPVQCLIQFSSESNRSVNRTQARNRSFERKPLLSPPFSTPMRILNAAQQSY
jgi:hypothetical protein